MTAKLRSLRSNEGFRQFVLDQLEALDVRARSMFGGTGLYSGEYFFGIIARDRLFLKVDKTTRARFVEEKMKPFRPYPDRGGTMQYYEVPVAVLESPLDLERWARDAVNVAKQATTEVRSSRRARPRTSKVRRARGRTRQ